MRLPPREHEKVTLNQLGFLAQSRLARGLRLNQAEATALIASQLQERIRDGVHSVADLMQHGKNLLGRRHVLPSVPALIHDVQVEGTFRDGYIRFHDFFLFDVLIFREVFFLLPSMTLLHQKMVT